MNLSYYGIVIMCDTLPDVMVSLRLNVPPSVLDSFVQVSCDGLCLEEQHNFIKHKFIYLRLSSLKDVKYI